VNLNNYSNLIDISKFNGLTLSIKNDATGFIIEQYISHGPWTHDTIQDKYVFTAATIKSNIYVKWTANSLDNLYEIFEASTLATFNNQFITEVKSSTVNINLPNISIQWEGFNGNIDITPKNNHINAFTTKLINNPLTIKFKNYTLKIIGMTLESSMSHHPVGLWEGNQIISMSQINFNVENNNFTINHFTNQSKFGVDQQNRYHYSSQANMGECIIPNLTIHSLQMTYSLFGINSKGLIDFILKSQTIRKNGNISNEEKQAYQIVFTKIFTPSINFTANLIANTDFGTLTIYSKADWPENKNLPNNLYDIKMNGRAHLDVIIPVALVDHLLDAYFKKIQPPTEVTSSLQEPAKPTLQTFQDQLDDLQNKDEISTSVKTRIYNIAETHPTSDSFSSYIDQLILLNEISEKSADLVKNQYSILEKTETDDLKKQSEAPSLPPPPAQPATPQAMVNARINAFKEMGYVIENNNNYTTTITFENGQLKINEKVLPHQ